jgi:hypothetical protein
MKHLIKKQKKTAGMLATEVRTGDAPKLKFSMKTYMYEKNKKWKSTPCQP